MVLIEHETNPKNGGLKMKDGWIKLKDLKRGEYFKKTETAKKVYIKEDYNRSTKKFDCVHEDDVWGTGFEFKGDKEVFINFEY